MTIAAPLLAQTDASKTLLTITVTDSTNAPVPLAQIRLCPRPSGKPLFGATGQYGQFSLDLPVGSYELMVTHPLLETAKQPIELRKGAPQTVRVALRPADGEKASAPRVPKQPPVSTKVLVNVVDPTGAPIPKARVWGLGGVSAGYVETDADGNAETIVPSGEYTIVVMSFGFAQYKNRIELTRAAQQRIGITLRIGQNSGPVIVSSGPVDPCNDAVWPVNAHPPRSRQH